MAMRERGTETIEPYEPPEEPTYDWEYEDEPAYRGTPKILWGRLVVLGVFLLIAFFIGRALAGGGVSQDDFDQATAQRNDARAQASEARAEVADLERSVAALQDEVESLQQAQTGTTGEDTGTEAPPVEGETYVVKQGDTLRGIAEKFYGDATLDDYIAEANDISDPSAISTGSELTIPPDPEP
jgi:cell division protein FtsB